MNIIDYSKMVKAYSLIASYNVTDQYACTMGHHHHLHHQLVTRFLFISHGEVNSFDS